jgi:hypothetical protein
MTMWGEVLEQLNVTDLRDGRTQPGLADRLGRDHPLLAGSAPTNQQILDATKAFYGQNQALVDLTTTEGQTAGANQKPFIQQLNANNWQSDQSSNTLTSSEQNQSSQAIFNQSGGGGNDDCGGIFGGTMCNVKASDLFSTVAVGVSAEAIVGIGGLGGLGCAWDIAGREGPKGYGYVTLELGIKVEIDVNIQAAIFNLLPSQLTTPIYGLNVGAGGGLAASFQMFFTGDLTILGYAIAIGVGAGGGAAVFGGKCWAFG